jgi:hypothetical protein
VPALTKQLTEDRASFETDIADLDTGFEDNLDFQKIVQTATFTPSRCLALP